VNTKKCRELAAQSVSHQPGECSMRDGLHRKPHRDPGCHLQGHRRQCDGKRRFAGRGYPYQIRPQERYTPGYPQLCYGDIFDQIRNPGKRSGLREDYQLDQAILFPTKWLTVVGFSILTLLGSF
jgi:hypothetical protein